MSARPTAPFYQIWGLSRHEVDKAGDLCAIVVADRQRRPHPRIVARRLGPRAVEQRLAEVQPGLDQPPRTDHPQRQDDPAPVRRDFPAARACCPISTLPRSSKPRRRSALRARSATSSPSTAPTRPSGNGKPGTDDVYVSNRFHEIADFDHRQVTDPAHGSSGLRWCTRKTGDDMQRSAGAAHEGQQ